jgi:membrane associated rhomboid family serine protease
MWAISFCAMLPVVSHEARTSRWPYVTICLIGLNVLAFAFEASLGIRFAAFLQDWGIVPARINAEVTLHNVATVGTSMFLHVGVVHLLGNMWFLYVFGDAVEDALGHWWFLFLYLLCGFFGGMAFVAVHASSPLPAVGASAAVSGVMAASLVMWPRARLRVPGLLLLAFVCLILYETLAGAGVSAGWTAAAVIGLAVSGTIVTVQLAHSFVQGMVFGLRVPAWLVLGLYFGLQLLNGLLVMVDPAYGGSTGWWAHIGGFVAGAAFGFVFPKTPVVLQRVARG